MFSTLAHWGAYPSLLRVPEYQIERGKIPCSTTVNGYVYMKTCATLGIAIGVGGGPGVD